MFADELPRVLSKAPFLLFSREIEMAVAGISNMSRTAERCGSRGLTDRSLAKVRWPAGVLVAVCTFLQQQQLEREAAESGACGRKGSAWETPVGGASFAETESRKCIGGSNASALEAL